MASKRCIFCDVQLDPSRKCLPSSETEEHIFARWFRDAVANKNIRMYSADGDAEPKLHRNPPLERLVNTRVCRSCNNGWMSKLEVAIAPLVSQLQSGSDISSFTEADVELLARWSAKTAAVLSHVTPQLKRVPKIASLSIHPDSSSPPKMRFFYCQLSGGLTLEGGYLQIVYGEEIGLIGTHEVPATRIILCIHNHCLIVDFPPTLEGVMYDLSASYSSMLWPTFIPAGIPRFAPEQPATIHQVLRTICGSIQVDYDLRKLQN